MKSQPITEPITAIFTGTDERNWPKVENAFTEKVLLDYSSMSGEAPVTLNRSEIITKWKTLLPGFDSTKHKVSNFEITMKDNEAIVTANGHATHYLTVNEKKEEWIVDGHYVFHLKNIHGEWKAASMKFIKENISGNPDLPKYAQEKVKKESAIKRKVTFESEGLVLTGTLHLPGNFTETNTYIAVVVTGSWITVKEQMPDLYAAKLAENGYVGFTFDFRSYGESEGQPNNYEVPQLKAEDIKNAVDYLKTLSFVKKNNIDGLAICASSGYMAEAIINGADIKTVTFVAPWLHNYKLVEGLYGGKEGVTKKITEGEAAKKKFAETGKVDYVPAASTTDSNAAMFGNFEYYLNPARGAIKEWNNQFAVMGWKGWLEYDPIPYADRISIPVLIVHSKTAAVPPGAEEFYTRLKGTKNIIWVDKATQFDFYDQEPYTTNAANAATEWFHKY